MAKRVPSDATCTLCGRQVTWRPVNFISDGKLWRVELPICVNEECLSRREGTFVEHRSKD